MIRQLLDKYGVVEVSHLRHRQPPPEGWQPTGTPVVACHHHHYSQPIVRIPMDAEKPWSDPSSPGLRYNAGKPRYDLIPPEALEALAMVYTRGAEKYAPRNWEAGVKWSEACFAALQRHAWAWMRGEDIDPESGLPHMMHAAWNAMAILTYQQRGVGTDDRPKIGGK